MAVFFLLWVWWWGEGGVWRQVTVFEQPHYLANFVQATFNALPADKVKGDLHTVGRLCNISAACLARRSQMDAHPLVSKTSTLNVLYWTVLYLTIPFSQTPYCQIMRFNRLSFPAPFLSLGAPHLLPPL